MPIFVSEPARPAPSRLPESLRVRRAEDPDQMTGTHASAAGTEKPVDPAQFRSRHNHRERALAEYQEELGGERELQAPYLPVSQLMAGQIISIDAREPLEAALQLMERHGIHHLVVVSGDSVAGLVDTGWVHRELAEGAPASQPLATETLPAFITVTQETDAHDLARHMLANDLSAALVVNTENHPTGIVTDRDYLRLYAHARELNQSI